ncbi:DUF3306 domain-containing protein [Bradyrhizobium sp. WSM 1738]|uniref:DUF3306 domain-containing protein n=1 Tax=Bradyrhizobium hereditatis TaxID=2821405 RepID=UPI001CE286D5|nr:DUF3306 domain-containing protein [Bradyrhizobium hereditatis]MCA6116326.1 DUF3306 domain-containing protein [Bradyrhizobium hereditatis]
MSGPDEADRDKGFLARWSQRKLEAKQPEAKPATSATESVESSRLPATPGEDAAPEFDLSSLPKLEELTAGTDITAFLRKGVPEHLRNAALRQSWALDPAIRNYVSPALEYAYDWNAPGGVPGGGELGAGVDVARLVSQIMGERAAENLKSDANPENDVADSLPHEREGPSESQAELPMQPVRRAEEAVEPESASKVENAADGTLPVCESEPAKSVAPQQPLRRHGTAKPIV